MSDLKKKKKKIAKSSEAIPDKIMFNHSDDTYKHLSINSPATVVIKSKGTEHVFATALAAYIWLVSEDDELKSKVENCLDIKRISYYASNRSGFVEPEDKIRLKALKKVARAKHSKGHPFFTNILKGTGEAELVSHHFWEKDDSFLGIAKSGKGKNHWGKILMKVRSEL